MTTDPHLCRDRVRRAPFYAILSNMLSDTTSIRHHTYCRSDLQSREKYRKFKNLLINTLINDGKLKKISAKRIQGVRRTRLWDHISHSLCAHNTCPRERHVTRGDDTHWKTQSQIIYATCFFFFLHLTLLFSRKKFYSFFFSLSFSLSLRYNAHYYISDFTFYFCVKNLKYSYYT